jgi:hypothetical protein
MLADVGFGVAVVGAIAAASLYFARPRWTAAPATTGRATVSAAPIAGGAAVLVQGSY